MAVGESSASTETKMPPNSATDAIKAVTNDNGEVVKNQESSAEISKSEIEKDGKSAKPPDAAPVDCPASPQVQTQIYPQYHPHLTPQAAGYYHYGNPQVTPEPPSPAGGYGDVSFLQQQAALGVFGTPGQYGIPQAPLSPSRSGMTVGSIHPHPSPLFPRANQQNQVDSNVLQRIQGQTPGSPSVPFMSPNLHPSSGSGALVYQGYGGGTSYASVVNGNSVEPGQSPSDDKQGWGERNPSHQSGIPQYPQASPQLQGQGYPGMSPTLMRGVRGDRSYSFDDNMLPPSVLDQDPTNPPFSPYQNNQGPGGNALFPQPWAYGAANGMYNAPPSPLQPRASPQMQGHFPGGHPGMMPPMYAAEQGMPPFYPATSPGPPIQTTASNKGPDGANLFIFHIPNHFTNLDMYRLFCQYGNLLSVRIMVEKETGRSRGFGFVSYDSTESAALAIKELNGFAIGNKRLKVQHKQIRGEQQRSNSFGDSPSFIPRHDLPPSGQPPMGISSTPWFDAATQPPEATPALPPAVPTEGFTESNNDGEEVTSALPSLEPLRNALPDVSGQHEGATE